MSGARESRAAVFTSRPQDVEVYQAGAWWPGSLLGWRHDSSGGCEVWVRVVIGGVEETAWTDLSTLRLPERSSERHLAMAPSLSATEQLKVAAGRMAAPESTDPSATQSLPAVRNAATASVPLQRTGGRRRAPEPGTAELAMPETSATMAAVPGRHRAAGPGAGPIPLGRHRAADTGIWSTIPAEPTGRSSGPVDAAEPIGVAVPSSGGRRRADRSGAAVVAPPTVAAPIAPAPIPPAPISPAPAAAGPVDAWSSRTAPPPAAPRRTAARDIDADLLTRPMRLDDLVGQSRRKPRLDGFVRA